MITSYYSDVYRVIVTMIFAYDSDDSIISNASNVEYAYESDVDYHLK